MNIMNEIFKVVYSAAKQCYVVTSEFAKSNGKKAGIVVAGLLLISGVHVVNAVDTIDGPRIKRLEIEVRDLKGKVSTISSKIESTNNEQININKQKSEANEAAITELSNKVNALGGGTGTTGTKDQEQDTKIQANTDKVTAHDTAINDLTPKVTKNTEDLAKVEGKINDAKAAAIVDAEGKIATAKSEAITEAGTKADEKVTALKTELEPKIEKAKTDAIADAEGKIATAKTELTEKITEAKDAATAADTKATNAQAAAEAADAKAAEAQKAAKAAAEAATTKSDAAKTAAVAEAGTQADEKIKTAKEAIANDITAAKNEAITKAGENAEEKITEAKIALEKQFQGLDNTTVKLEKYDKDIAALQETEKAHDARITAVEKDVKVVGANAAALAALKPLQYNPGQTTQIMAGVGTYRGQRAVALGAAHYTSENLMYHAGVSFGNGSGTMANAGVTIGFGSGEGAKMSSSKVAELQSTVDRLTAENEQVKAALYDIYAKLQAK